MEWLLHEDKITRLNNKKNAKYCYLLSIKIIFLSFLIKRLENYDEAFCCSDVHLWNFLFCFQFMGGSDREDQIQEIVKDYRSMDIKKEGTKHLSPLSQELKEKIVKPTKEMLDAMMGEKPKESLFSKMLSSLEAMMGKKPEESLFSKMLSSLEDLEKDKTTTPADIFKFHLDFAAAISKKWTDGDKELLGIYMTDKKINLKLDERLSLKDSVLKVQNLFLPDSINSHTNAIDKVGVLFFPVVGEALFSLEFLTECFIQNVFPVAFPTKGDLSTHTFPTSYLGHALHDIAHGMIALNTKKQEIEDEFQEFQEKLPFGEITFDECKTLKRNSINFSLNKNRAFESALLQIFLHFKAQENKKAIAGMFFRIHEAAGSAAWISPDKINADLNCPIKIFFQEGINSFEEYYEDCFETSPKDGRPAWGDDIPDTVRKLLDIPEKAPTKVIPHGSTVEIKWLSKFEELSLRFRTQKWLFQESQDVQKVIAYGLGQKNEFSLPTPKDSDSVDIFREYNNKSLKGLVYILQKTEKEILKFLLTDDAGKKITDNFFKNIKEIREKFLTNIQEIFQEKSYWPLIEGRILNRL